MKKIFLIALLLLSALVQSCGTTKEQPVTVKYIYERDSVVVTNNVIDTIIRVEADSAMIRALIECDSLGQAHIREILAYKGGKRMQPPAIKIKDNVLNVSANSPEFEQKISLLTKQLEFYKRQIAESQTTKIVFKTNTWQRIRLWIADIALAVGIGFLIYIILYKRRR